MSNGQLADEVGESGWPVWRDRIRKLPWVPLLIVAAMVLVGALAPLLTAHSPYKPSLPNRLQPPSGEYLLGTDALGRDLLTRLFFGARITLIIIALAMVVGGGTGLVLGTLAGYVAGKVDILISRVVDALLAFPPIFFALLFAVSLGPGLKSVVLAISLVLWARFARVIRGEVLAVKELDFVAQARVNGCSDLRIIMVHILPNVANTFMVLLSLNIGWVITVEASLSFLGAGIPPPTPSWGAMIAEGQQYISSAWWISIVPGLAITLEVLAFNLFGDWLRDFLDPKLREQL